MGHQHWCSCSCYRPERGVGPCTCSPISKLPQEGNRLLRPAAALQGQPLAFGPKKCRFGENSELDQPQAESLVSFRAWAVHSQARGQGKPRELLAVWLSRTQSARRPSLIVFCTVSSRRSNGPSFLIVTPQVTGALHIRTPLHN